MDNHLLYGYLYTDETNGDNRMTIYQGIYLPGTPTNTRLYSIVRHLGNVNITQRFFLKSRKFPRKIEKIENNILILNDYTQLRPIQDIILELGFQQDFVDLVINTVINSSNDKKVMTYESFQQYGLTYEDMPEDMPLSMVGKVSF
jgi:hypothetical protein